MKIRKFLSGLLFGTGCALSFIALLAIILPGIDNPQLQLVLDSFDMLSEHPAVQLMNAFMTFALQQSWHLLYLGLLILGLGAALLLHFMPKQKKDAPVSILPPVQPKFKEPELANPYANISYQELPLKEHPVHNTSFLSYTEPMLERNRIEEKNTKVYSETQPYFSPRLKVESQAIETNAGKQSQSGSCILIRNVYEASEISVQIQAKESRTSATPAAPPPPVLSPPSEVPAPASRIRSTMGRHSAGSSSFSHFHS